MSVRAAGTSVRASVEVDAPIERAFHLFTDNISSWWDPEHHILRAELAEMVFEPRVGGYVYDRGVDGSECRWARVFAYEPPHRFVISWDISAQWQLRDRPRQGERGRGALPPGGPERTRVELEHRNLERHGEGWEGMRDALGSPGGWPAGLRAFAERLKA